MKSAILMFVRVFINCENKKLYMILYSVPAENKIGNRIW